MALAGGIISSSNLFRNQADPIIGWRGTEPIRRSQSTTPQYNLTPQQAYPASIQQTGEDYSTIMNAYRNLLTPSTNPEIAGLKNQYTNLLNQPTVNPSLATYTQSPEFNESYNILKNLAETGGLSEAEQGSLRARGISPIRAVYANAMRELDRQRALSGGYSPNYAAASARMARDLSEKIAGATTDVNAAIAEMLQKGRLSAAPQLGQMGTTSTELRNRINLANTEARNRAAEINAQRQLEALRGLTSISGLENENILNALRGMTSLYGTTPALTETFGRQALQAAQQNPIREIRRVGTGVVAPGFGLY